MRRPLDAFIKPHYAEIEIADVVEDWLVTLEVQSVSLDIINNYRKVLLSFRKSLTLQNLPLTLTSLTDVNVQVWKADLRAGSLETRARRRGTLANPWFPPSKSAVQSNLSVLKEFATRWLKDRYARVNLLETVYVGRGVREPLSQAERFKLLQECGDGDFESVRNRTFIELLLASRCRFKEVHGLTTDDVGPDGSLKWVTLDTGRRVPVNISGSVSFRIYRGRRRLVAGPTQRSLWVTDTGKPLSYWAAYAIFLRLAAKTGVDCNPRRFGYTVAQRAAKRGLQEPNSQSRCDDQMAPRDVGDRRQNRAAKLAVKYSLAGTPMARVPNPPTRKVVPPRRPAPRPTSSPPDAETPEWRGPGKFRW